MVHEANGSNNLSSWLQSIIVAVAWIANNERSFGNLSSWFNTSYLSCLIKDNFFAISVQHVGSTMNCTKSWEGLWKSTNTIDWVKEWTVTISSLGVKIKLHLLYCVNCWLAKICILVMKGHSMAQEINCILVDTIFGENIFHWRFFELKWSPSFLIFLVKSINEFVQVDYSLLLKQTH